MKVPPELHIIDLAVVVGYLIAVIFVGKSASGSAKTEEGFFLAGRKLGKLLQFFLNFGSLTNSDTAVSTTSAVYQQGASGAWLSFAAVFVNPYYWFMAPWFRRVRLITMSDIFEDRFGSVGLSRFYAIFQIGVAVLYIGLANLISYKVAASLIANPPSPWWFYLIYTSVVAIYISLGGLRAAALNEALQGILMVFFSGILIPFGLKSIGGWHALSFRLPPEMFSLFGRSSHARFTFWSVSAILFVTIVQANGGLNVITIAGAAKNEFDARLGIVAGGYAKRLMIILWTFVALIALAIYGGSNALSDPDMMWGTMATGLLGRGLLGLMVAGLLAGNMSLLGTQAISVSALFARNLVGRGPFRLAEAGEVRLGRFAIAGVLGLGVAVASLMDDVVSIMLLLLSVNLAFGAAILLAFFWRRVTAAAVWAAVILTSVVTMAIPFGAQTLEAVRSNPQLVLTATSGAPPVPVFFEKLLPAVSPDGVNRVEGRGRFNFEVWLLARAGFEVRQFSPGQLLTAQFFIDGTFPFIVLALVSCLTSPVGRERSDRFYGKMKTPVGATPELERQAMAATLAKPDRFDGQKLFPRSTWEFSCWTAEDTVGFVACCAVSASIVALFCGLLRWFA